MSAGPHLVCPACAGVNRLPADRNPLEGRCGKCGAKLFHGAPILLGAGNFDAHAERSDIPLVVDFWAPWCAPCRMMEPAFERAAARLEPRARLAKVNTDAEQRLAGRFAIRGIPTVVMFRKGREEARQSGAMDFDTLVAWVTSRL